MTRLRIFVAALLLAAGLATYTPAVALSNCSVYATGQYTSTICGGSSGTIFQYAQHTCRGQGGTLYVQRGRSAGVGEYSVAGPCPGGAPNISNRHAVQTNSP